MFSLQSGVKNAHYCAFLLKVIITCFLVASPVWTKASVLSDKTATSSAKLSAKVSTKPLTKPSMKVTSKLQNLSASVPPFPPFTLKKQTILCQGISKRILNLIGHQTNIQFQYQAYPYARILHALTIDSLDVALIFKNDTLKSKVEYIGPVARSKVLVLTNNAIALTQYQDLTALAAIAVIRKAHFEPRFDNDTRLKKIYVENYTQGLAMFFAGRVEGIVGSKEGLEYAMEQLNYNTNELNQAFYLGDKEWWLHVSNNVANDKLISLLTSGVSAIYTPNLIYDLYKAEQDNGCYQQ